MPRSMTGFARIEAQQSWGTLACEIRSVNHRYLEPTIRLPEQLRTIENDFRVLLKKKLSRGKVEANIHIKLEDGNQDSLALNEELAKNIHALAAQISDSIPNAAPINPLDILRWPGVLKTTELNIKNIQDSAITAFNEALDKLIENRQREGAELRQVIEQKLHSIEEKVIAVRKVLPEILAQNQVKLREKLDSLKTELDEDRLTQELVYIAQKTDVAEELDRLDAHLVEIRLALTQQQPIGRRLDFLMQELNREANTLSSKSISIDTTQHAVDIKVLIEQMREQIQNIE